MKVLVVEPGYSPYETQIENTNAAIAEILEAEQHDVVYPFGNRVIPRVLRIWPRIFCSFPSKKWIGFSF